MTDSVTYSRPYAEAAYKIAVDTNELDMWTDNLSIRRQRQMCIRVS